MAQLDEADRHADTHTKTCGLSDDQRREVEARQHLAGERFKEARQALRAGKYRMLEILVEAYPHWLSRSDLGAGRL